MREKGKGVGKVGGWGRDRQRNRQVNAQALSKLPFSNLPFIFSPNGAQRSLKVSVLTGIGPWSALPWLWRADLTHFQCPIWSRPQAMLLFTWMFCCLGSMSLALVAHENRNLRYYHLGRTCYIPYYPKWLPQKNIYFELIWRGVLYYGGHFLPRIFVLELIMRDNSAACYVEKPRLGASGVKNDARKSHRN